MDTNVLRKKLGDRHKLTAQREAIFRVLNQSAKDHMSPEEVCTITRKTCPEVGLATVYRTLHLFEQVGVVKKLDVGKGRCLYELCKNVGHHHHMVCLECGCVLDMCLADSQMEDNPGIYGGFQPVERRVLIYGYCSACLRKKKNLAKEAVAQSEC
ncbi:Fur family transcriptional regulator [Anaeroarcus burkinensis]|uniref:Fur family transcriptional regulator n=1 Tax=Anaeroarcus burkinensis TaxID=82376 RepID=UPI0004229736|nr:transcriptional repressor [Anaeroarcus burkinensis]